MTRELGTFDKLAAEIGQALLPLREALSSTNAFVGLLGQLGWTVTDIPAPLRDLGTGLDTLFDSLSRLLGAGGVNSGGTAGDPDAQTGGVSADEAARVLKAVQDVIAGIRAIATAPASSIPPALRADGFSTVFPRQLVDYLVVTYLQRFHPSIGFALRALGVIRSSFAPATGGRPSHIHVSVDPGDLSRVLADPTLLLTNAYRWGGPDFDFAGFAAQVDNVLAALGLYVRIETPSPAATEALGAKAVDPFAAPPRVVTAVLFDQVIGDAATAATLGLFPLPAGDGAPPGVAILPTFVGELGVRLELGSDLVLTIRSDLDLQGGVGLLARPGRPIDMVLGFEADGTPVHRTGSVELAVGRSGADTDRAPVVLLGSPEHTRLQFRSIGGRGGVRLNGSTVDAFVEVDVRGLEFVFRPEDVDGFIAAILPGDGFSIGADLAVGLSHQSGFYFRGTSNLDLQLPVHLQVGPIEIQGLSIAAAPAAGAVPVTLGASFKATLGPVTAVVDRIGLSALFAGRPDHDGNLGPLDVSVGFKPPTGVGLSISAGSISGGGFLSFDPARGEYAGALELEFGDFLQLKAIGLITTRMPDGSEGFSLLVVITAEFGSGIQLGLGFTLLAVGGLLGLNRGLNLQALLEGVQTGSIESVGFPRDVVANAPRILSDLGRFFPVKEGTFLIGPMAKIGWGTPTLVSLSVAVIIEVPGNVAVAGVLRAALPRVDLPLLELTVTFLGALELDKSRLWFFARLVPPSRVLQMTLEGEMGVLVAWGDNPDLVLTVGGFHPGFRPPQLPFSTPARLSVDILNRSHALIRVSGYFAITSNTVQFGASAYLKLGFDDFGLEGYADFDALFQFSPFKFVTSTSASVSLKAFGVGVFTIHLDLRLEGPAPWHAHGTGSIGFLFFEISADFDLTWGETRATTLPPVAVLPLLAAEIDKVEGWETRLPSGGNRTLVNLRQLPPGEDLVLHPLGTLLVRQRALPLNVRVDRVGAQRASDGRRFSVAPATGSGLTQLSVTADRFAMAQFQDLSEADRLSRPSFETQDAGVELTAAGGARTTARVVRRSARYELHVIDSAAPPAPTALATAAAPAPARTVQTKRFHTISGPVFDELLRGSSTSRAPLSQRESRLRQPFAAADTVRVTEQRYVVAYVRSNRQAFPPGGRTARTAAVTFRSLTAAQDALADFVTADPTLAGQLHVIPAAEAAVAPAAAGTWLDAGTLPTPAVGAELVRLANGRVLLAGGADAAGVALAASALFDPTADAWSAGPRLATARQRHTVTRRLDGRILVTGGRGAPTQSTVDGPVLASVEVFDPAAAAWTPGPALHTARSGHSATLLDDGRILVAGGRGARDGQAEAALVSAELFDPATGTWQPAGSMTDPRSDHQAVLLADGRVLVVGGAQPTGDGGSAALAYCEVYDPATDRWSPTGRLAQARHGHQAVRLPDGRVLVTGGDPVVADDGTFDPHSLTTAERYDPVSGQWSAAAGLPGGCSRHRLLRLRSDTVLLIGGTGGPELTAGFRTVLTYDPVGDAWIPQAGLNQGRADFGAVELADDRVLVAGGLAAAAGAGSQLDVIDPADTAEVLIP